MLRIVVQRTDATNSIHIGGPVENEVRTYDVDVPALERFLRVPVPAYASVQVIGVEVVEPFAVEPAAELNPSR